MRNLSFCLGACNRGGQQDIFLQSQQALQCLRTGTWEGSADPEAPLEKNLAHLGWSICSSCPFPSKHENTCRLKEHPNTVSKMSTLKFALSEFQWRSQWISWSALILVTVICNLFQQESSQVSAMQPCYFPQSINTVGDVCKSDVALFPSKVQSDQTLFTSAQANQLLGYT